MGALLSFLAEQSWYSTQVAVDEIECSEEATDTAIENIDDAIASLENLRAVVETRAQVDVEELRSEVNELVATALSTSEVALVAQHNERFAISIASTNAALADSEETREIQVCYGWFVYIN